MFNMFDITRRGFITTEQFQQGIRRGFACVSLRLAMEIFQVLQVYFAARPIQYCTNHGDRSYWSVQEGSHFFSSIWALFEKSGHLRGNEFIRIS